MNKILLAPSGIQPDVSFYDHRWVATWQDGPKLFVRGSWVPINVMFSRVFDLAPGAAAFARLDGRFLVFRRGDDPVQGGEVILVDLATGRETLVGRAGGTDCVAIGHGYVWYQRVDRWVWRWSGQTHAEEPVRQLPGLTGISRVFPDGSFSSVDEDRIQPFGSRPCWDGDVVVAEREPSGVVVLQGDRSAVLWPGEDTQTPRVAVDGNSAVVVTWGVQGVRLMELTLDELQAAAPEPVPDTSGEELDMLDYYFGRNENWPRTGSHPMQMVRSDDERWAIITKFANPDDIEAYRWDDRYIYHHEDRTNREFEPHGYYFTNGAWLERRMRPGAVLRVPSNVKVSLLPGCGDGAMQPYPYTMTLVARYLEFPCGGDLGSQDVVVVKYDPRPERPAGQRRPGGYEFGYHARGHGCVAWESWRTKDDNSGDERTARTVFNMLSNNLVDLRMPCRPFAVPTPQPTPEPEEPTMFSPRIIPRDVTFKALERLRAFYRDAMHRELDDDGLAAYLVGEWTDFIINGLIPGTFEAWFQREAEAWDRLERTIRREQGLDPR